MKPLLTLQEIILVTDTKFAAKEYVDRDESCEPKLSNTEKLADACWNGMLRDRLPEISMESSENKKPLPVWELSEGNHLFYVKLGDLDTPPDADSTLNPYRFLAWHLLN